MHFLCGQYVVYNLYPLLQRNVIYLIFRMGVGKHTLENKIIEEVSYLIDAMREENGKAFDVNVSHF